MIHRKLVVKSIYSLLASNRKIAFKLLYVSKQWQALYFCCCCCCYCWRLMFFIDAYHQLQNGSQHSTTAKSKLNEFSFLLEFVFFHVKNEYICHCYLLLFIIYHLHYYFFCQQQKLTLLFFVFIRLISKHVHCVYLNRIVAYVRTVCVCVCMCIRILTFMNRFDA